MSIKSWIRTKMSGVAGRPDLRSPVLTGGVTDVPSVIRRDPHRGGALRTAREPQAQYLGPYAPLIGAIRDELSEFVVSYLSLHLAIAERDRYLLTSIEVRATSPDDEELIRRFVREFKPEQIKRYLAKELIAALPNAGALDLSQFAGFNAGRDDEAAEDEDDYSELLAELRSAEAGSGSRRFEVALVGRWSEKETSARTSTGAHALRSPLAGAGIEVRIEDADGIRRATLDSALPGRRYAIGKDERCDVVVKGLYASRRHCEIWLDRGAWWVTDAGSTNGIRVERGSTVLGRSGGDRNEGGAPAVLEIPVAARIVLSASADGSPAQYPRLALEVMRESSVEATPIAPAPSLRATPSTPIFLPGKAQFAIVARTASGERAIELRAGALPVSVGRSRKETLAIDWAHEGVSGHHMEIVAMDDSGVTVDVHGDNGVRIGGTSHAQGERLVWKPGETMTLGRSVGREPECRLTLTRAD